MALSDRIPYQAQIDRPKLTLPGGKKLAVWVILNVEEWRIENAQRAKKLAAPARIRVGTDPGTQTPVQTSVQTSVQTLVQAVPPKRGAIT